MRVRNNTLFSDIFGIFANISAVSRSSTGITEFNGYYGVQRVGGCSYGLPTINHYLVKWLDSADGWGHTIPRAHFFGSLQYSRHAKHRQTNTQIDVIQGRTFNGNSISWRLVS